MSTESLIVDAIHRRHAVSFVYDGDGLPARVGHPHALYFGPGGDTRVEVLQVAGYSRSAADLPAWRSFDVLKITTAKPLEERFDVDPGWDPHANKYAGGILAMV